MGVQLFFKSMPDDPDSGWWNCYGKWHNITQGWAGGWATVTAVPDTVPSEFCSYVDSLFKPDSVIAIGLKIALNDSDSVTDTLDAVFYLDDLHWGDPSTPPQYSFEVLENSIEEMEGVHADYISLIPRWFMDDAHSSTIQPDTLLTPSDSLLELTMGVIHNARMHVMLKPHVDVKDGTWRGDIAPTDSSLWYDQYEDFINHYARIAAENNVELFCVGTELDRMTCADTARWGEIIDTIRAVLGGTVPLTYAANWDGYSTIDFYQRLDYFGIDAYFPLTAESVPSLDSLVAGWSPVVAALDTFQRQIGKPIIFTEIGYSSRDSAASDPWHSCSWGSDCGHSVNSGLQADCYEAVFQVLSGPGAPEWFAGLFWWNWEAFPDAGGYWDRNFTPQWKPAQTILRHYFRSTVDMKPWRQHGPFSIKE